MKFKAVVFWGLLACGGWMFGHGAYIHAKALLAQLLLEAAWADTRSGQKEVKPWPWADTWPVGRLSVPRLGIRRIVLAGANGPPLAFGPGHLLNTAAPGEPGNSVLAGHRDTHFRFLRELIAKDMVEIETPAGHMLQYRVVAVYVSDENDEAVVAEVATTRLTLVTCYPFDAVWSGGPLRYVVVADAVDEPPPI
jgi:sortase A